MKKVNSLEVKEIFNSKYIIPIYQRNYAWESDEIEALLDDIKNYSGVGYFIGSLVVREKDGFFEVIDGQQRLTTLFLILKYLESKQDIEYTEDKLKFEAREKSNVTLSKICKDVNLEDLPSAEIASGFSVIRQYLEKNQNFDKNKILNARILRVSVPDDADLNHFFEIMNTRGEQLEAHQIAKANILNALQNDSDKKIAALVWDACADMDRYVQMGFSTDIRKEIFGGNWEKVCVSQSELFGISLNDEEENSESKSLDEILKLNLSANKAAEDKDENIRFSSIINFPNFLLQVNAAIDNISTEISTNELLDDKNLIKNLPKHWGDNEKAKNFIYNLLKFRFLFDKFIIKTDNNDKKDGEKWSLKMLKKYSNNGKDTFGYVDTFSDNRLITILQSCLRITYTSPRAMEWIYSLLKSLANNESVSGIQEFLEKYAIGKVSEALKNSSSYPTCERIVFSYLDYVLYRDCVLDNKNSEIKSKLQSAFDKIKNKNLKTLQEWEFGFRSSVEHFYPQHPSAGSIEPIENKDILNSFGNLALITTSGNSKFSNLAPSAKLNTYPSIITQSLKLILMSECIKSGNLDEYKQAIGKHGEEMLGILRKS